MELGIAYSIVSFDGRRAVVGNGDPARLDPDYVGWLDADNGIAISRNVRTSADDLVAEHGGVLGPYFWGRSSISLQGKINPEPDVAAANGWIKKLKRAARSLEGDGQLIWTPTGDVERYMPIRLAQSPGEGTGRPRPFALQFDSWEYRALATALRTTVLGANAAGNVLNDGDEDATPTFRIQGPATNPIIENLTSGLSLRLTYTLASGHYLSVDAHDGTILLDGAGSPLDGIVDFANSTWWQLLAETANSVRLTATGTTGASGLTVYSRDSYAP